METKPNNDTACPYCGAHFAKPPQRRLKCKACAGLVIVKAEPETWQKRLMTVDQAMATEQRWERFEHRRALAQAMDRLGIGAAHVDAVERNLSRRAKGPVPMAHLVDACFRAFETQLRDDQAFWASWAILAERLGLNPMREQREQFRCAIAQMARLRCVAGVRVNTSPGCRAANCITLQRFVPMDEALRRPPLPCQMTHRCYGYLKVELEDEAHDTPSAPAVERPAAPKPWWRRWLGR